MFVCYLSPSFFYDMLPSLASVQLRLVRGTKFHFIAILLFLLLNLNYQTNILVHSTHQFETIHSEEVSWEFEDDTNGWGNSTTEELHTELYV
jgi:hypothetical protein